ncbi:MAG: hypothetical protein H7A05_06520 [Pseudomonadales bacterium]|nr:hypothetical protein [Pseudomonadales bacterium]MCP5330629.1 hypothetical protein [Pseudomonadales bacterium]MCP5344256.1 hypothetical protein [Pseudomonadales bacterium]
MNRAIQAVASTLLLLFVALLGGTVALAAERTVTAPALQEGSYAVGSSNLSLNDSKVSQLSAEGLSSEQLLRGIAHNGSARYVDELLLHRDAALSFTLQVPNDSKLYGASAGTQIPYVAVLLYPTTATNARADYAIFPDTTLPHMQGDGEAALFASDSDRYPLLVYSHGSGGFPQSSQMLYLKTLASHGYMVLAVFHGDNRFGDTEERKFNLRPLTVKTALDVLLADSRFAGHIDTSRIGGLGESFGGATMMALLGGKKVNPDASSVIANDLITTTVDTRIGAAATIVPYMGQGVYAFLGNNSAGAATIDRPFMANSAASDEVTDYSKVQAALDQISGTKYLVQYDGEKHAMGAGATADAYAWMKIFVDAYVKKEAGAADLLASMSAVAGSGSDSLVKVNAAQTPVVFPEFADLTVSVKGVYVGADRYDVMLQLVSENPITFTLIAAENSAVSTLSTGSFSNNVLTIPRVIVNGAPYRVTMAVSNDNPIQFALSTADPVASP